MTDVDLLFHELSQLRAEVRRIKTAQLRSELTGAQSDINDLESDVLALQGDSHSSHAHGDLTGVTANQHHNEDHASRHAAAGADPITITESQISDIGTHVHDAHEKLGASGVTKSVTSTGAWEQAGSDLNFGEPSYDVKVHGLAVGYVDSVPASSQLARIRVRVSLDGGSTWTTGTEGRMSVGSLRYTSQVAAALASGTPSGDVLVRVEVQQGGGTAGDLGWVLEVVGDLIPD